VLTSQMIRVQTAVGSVVGPTAEILVAVEH
jgi:hypothetical protein